MGKKRTSQDHVQQSMGQMVSKAALAQMGPEIESMVRSYVQDMANQIAQQQASTLETMFSRIVVLEELAMEKQGITKDELIERVAVLQDRQEGLSKADKVEAGDVVRLEISTKTKDQAQFQGTSRYRVYNAGAGESLGKQLEEALIGMGNGEVKELEFGEGNSMVAKITVNRVSRAPKVEVASADQTQG